MSPLLKSQIDRLDHLAIVYQRLIHRTERTMGTINLLEERQIELREQLATVARQIEALQQKIEAIKNSDRN